jgi:hypothetical protein
MVSSAILGLLPIRIFSLKMMCYRYENDEKAVKMAIFV